MIYAVKFGWLSLAAASHHPSAMFMLSFVALVMPAVKKRDKHSHAITIANILARV